MHTDKKKLYLHTRSSYRDLYLMQVLYLTNDEICK